MVFIKGELPHGAKPFKKGQSGNPNGRPKSLPNSRKRLLKLLALTQTTVNTFTGQEEELTLLEQIHIVFMEKALNGDMKSYKEMTKILDRKGPKRKHSTLPKVGLDLEDELNIRTVYED